MNSAAPCARWPGGLGAGVRGAGPAPAGRGRGAAGGARDGGRGGRVPAEGASGLGHVHRGRGPGTLAPPRDGRGAAGGVRAARGGLRPALAADPYGDAASADGLPDVAAAGLLGRGLGQRQRGHPAGRGASSPRSPRCSVGGRGTGPAHARADGGRRRRRPAAGRGAHARAARAGRAPVRRRLRDRLLLLDLPQGVARSTRSRSTRASSSASVTTRRRGRGAGRRRHLPHAGLSVVAEGVEHEDQHALLARWASTRCRATSTPDRWWVPTSPRGSAPRERTAKPPDSARRGTCSTQLAPLPPTPQFQTVPRTTASSRSHRCRRPLSSRPFRARPLLPLTAAADPSVPDRSAHDPSSL